MAGIIERTLPRISVNKLGEYMTATPSRRNAIVRDQRRPKGFLVPRYNEAQSVIVSFLTSERRDPAAILRQIERLRSIATETDWELQRNTSCAEALEAFLEIADEFPPEQKLVAGPTRPPVLTYGEVSVSVRPELIVESKGRLEGRTVGAIKLYFSKTMPLSRESGAFVATALGEFTEQFLALSAKADYRLSRVVDIFARKLYGVPRSRIRRRNDLSAACEEIARAWNSGGPQAAGRA